jgi:hypothetical protein
VDQVVTGMPLASNQVVGSSDGLIVDNAGHAHRVPSGRDTGALSHGLLAELQRELSMHRDIMVIAPRDTYPTASVRLEGSVAVGKSQVRVNVIIVDNITEQIIWSQVFEQPMDNAVVATVRLAQDIAAALPFSREAATKATEQD